MSLEDNAPDPSFTTPSGQVLNKRARNPHLDADIVHSDVAGSASESVITLSLVDFVAEHSEGGTVETIAAVGDFSTRTVEGNNPFYVQPWGAVFWNSDGVSTGEYFASIAVVAGNNYTFQIGTSTSNTNNASLRAFFDDQTTPLLDSVSEYVFTATSTGIVDVGLRVLPNSGVDGINSINVSGLVGASIVPATCTPFVRKIIDGVPSDFEPDGVTPYVVVGEIKAHCPDDGTTPQPGEEFLQLVDIYEVGGSGEINLPVEGAWALNGFASFAADQIVLDGDSGFSEASMSQTGLVVGATYTLGFNANGTGYAGVEFYADGSLVTPITNAQFVANQSNVLLQLIVQAGGGYHRASDIKLYYDLPITQECKPFLRKISSEGATDYELDGTTPYTVQGIVGTTCSSNCGCTDEFSAMQSTLDNILTALQNPVTPPTATLLESGQPVLTLEGGASGATFTRDEIAHYGLSPSLIQSSGYNAFVSTPPQPSYILNSISFVPSDTFTLSVAGGLATTHDYTFAMTANSTPYQFEEVDDFSITIPANQTVTLHMTVGLYPTVTP
jgi:hypothetical protein